MASVQAVDPRTGRGGVAYPAASLDDVDAALIAAVAAAPELRDERRRTDALRRVAGGLRARGDAIVAVAVRETGLPEGRLRGELERTAVQLELLADSVAAGEHHDAIIDLADPDARPVPRPAVERFLRPVTYQNTPDALLPPALRERQPARHPAPNVSGQRVAAAWPAPPALTPPTRR